MIRLRLKLTLPLFMLMILGACDENLLAGAPVLSTSEESHLQNHALRPPPDVGGLGLGNSGLSLQLNYSDSLSIEDTHDALDLIDLKALIPFYGFHNDHVRLGLTGVYESVWLDSDLTGSRQLNSIGLNLDLTKASQAPGWTWMMRIRPEFSFENGAAFSDGWNFSFLGTLGYRFHDRLMIGAGVYAHYGFGDWMAFPSIGLIWRPTPETYVQITPPILNLAWMPGEKWTFYFNTHLFGTESALEHETERDVAELSLRMVRSTLGMEYQISEHLSMGVRLGLNYLGELELRDHDQRVLHDKSLQPSLFGGVGLKWSF